jgi:predicted aldo/keto reductase-like oxidoreductase
MTMRYKLLGRTGLRISELALGAMTFGEQWGWGASPQECARMLEAYGEAGGNIIDTAPQRRGTQRLKDEHPMRSPTDSRSPRPPRRARN